jgi:hypothetical protein
MIEGTNKRGKKGCMPFYHSPWSVVSKVVSIRRGKITWEEKNR